MKLTEDNIKYLALGLSNHSVSKFTVIDIADTEHDEIKQQILNNQEKAEKYDNMETELKNMEKEILEKIDSKQKHIMDKQQQELKKLKDSIEFQLDKHTGKVGYEYITKILKEILN